MKITTSDGQYVVKNQSENSPVYIQIQLGIGGLWSKPVAFLYDTGVTGTCFAVIPKSLLEELRLNLPIIGAGQSELADGSVVQNEKIALANVRLASIPAARPVVIEELVVAVSEDAKVPLINLGSCFRVLLKHREIVLMELDRSI